jgi:nucleoside triphosphatase
MAEQICPEPTVGALIFNEEGRIFLMVSPKWSGRYTVPGGHIEVGETAEEAVKRELKEETGLDVFDIKFLMFQECIFDKEFYEKKHFVFLDYICKTKNTKVILDMEEGTEFIWVTFEEALKLPLGFYTRKTILEYKEKYLNQ